MDIGSMMLSLSALTPASGNVNVQQLTEIKTVTYGDPQSLTQIIEQAFPDRFETITYKGEKEIISAASLESSSSEKNGTIYLFEADGTYEIEVRDIDLKQEGMANAKVSLQKKNDNQFHFEVASLLSENEELNQQILDSGAKITTAVPLEIKDTTAPVITFDEDHIVIEQGESLDMGTIHANDDKDGEVKVTVSGNLNTGQSGVYTLKAISSDANGNTSEKSFTVTVVPDYLDEIIGDISDQNALTIDALQYLGVPYVWGGTSPSGFDCSGLMQYVYRQNGIDIPRVAASQYYNGTAVNDWKPGDLIGFRSSTTGEISHIGMYLGGGKMIHALGSQVQISDVHASFIDSYGNPLYVIGAVRYSN